MLTRESFTAWLDAYGASWVGQNPSATLALFTDDASYMYTPLTCPHRLVRFQC